MEKKETKKRSRKLLGDYYSNVKNLSRFIIIE